MSAQSTAGTPQVEQLSAPARRRGSTVGVGAAIAIAIVLLLVGIAAGYFVYPAVNPKSSSSGSSLPALSETGSSLFYPLMTRWAANYSAATITPDSSGSGTGQDDAIHSLVNLGASDGYLTNASTDNVANFPAAISAQYIFYNLPGVSGHLNQNGTVLADIYDGTITNWNDSLIQAANPGVTLPSATIIPYARTDSSGDTFLFTSYVYMSTASWPYGAPSTKTLTTVDSHVTGETGNSGMVSGTASTKYSIAYIGVSYAAGAISDGLQYAAVGDNLSLSASGGTNAANYILPTGGATGTIAQDANLGLERLDYATYGMAVSLILGGSWAGAVTLTAGGGGSNPTASSPDPYPIVNLEYLIIQLSPTAGSTVVTGPNLAATVTFLQWAISTGNWAPGSVASDWIDQVGFLPLTAEVAGYDTQILASVSTS